MKDNPYKNLPPLERKPDGSLYRMTPVQKKQAASLIRRECCCFEDGNCIVLDDGDTCTCPSPLAAYYVLKKSNPSPYMFFMQDNDFTLFGATTAWACSGNRVDLNLAAGGIILERAFRRRAK